MEELNDYLNNMLDYYSKLIKFYEEQLVNVKKSKSYSLIHYLLGRLDMLYVVVEDIHFELSVSDDPAICISDYE